MKSLPSIESCISSNYRGGHEWSDSISSLTKPIIIATWPFGQAACAAGWQKLLLGSSALDAIEVAANITEDDPEVHSVGYGGLPNADGIVELDAALMNGPNHQAGSAAGMVGIPRAISVARRVMECTPHTLLVGDNARRFALREGFPQQDQLTESSRLAWEKWKEIRTASDVAHFENSFPQPIIPTELTPNSHDTIGLCALDNQGNLAVGCTTSGMAWKLPGRVGDSPIIGSGLYVDNEVGAAAGTGHGDEMMKVCLSYRVVMNMDRGMEPQAACIEALRYMMRKRPPELHQNYGAALIALRKDGMAGSAATFTGFKAPNQLWQWASMSEEGPILHEGVYVTSDSIIDSLV